MNIKDLIADIEKGDMIYRGFCHDCGISVEVTATLREDGAIDIGGEGSVYKVKRGSRTEILFKMRSMFQER